jgi:hypothetical protein
MNIRRCCFLVTAVVLVAVSGCGSGRVKVTGRVTYKGEPVPSTEVYFQPDDGSRTSAGKTDDDGRFSLRYSRQEDGAPTGQYKVRLKYAPSAEEETHQIPPKASRELKEVIAKYNDASKSDLHYEIKENGQFIEIKIPE